MKSTVVDESLSSFKPMYCSREYLTSTRRLIKLLKNIKAEGGINEETYKRMYATGAGSPKLYGLPKIHKPDTPLRPIVSSTGTVSYNTAKELAKILKPLVGMSTHHLQNTKDFIQQLKDVRLQQD